MGKDWRTDGLLNFGIFQPHTAEGKYEIPVISPEYEPPAVKWTGYNYARGMKRGEGSGVHFFLDDYQFAALWNNPKQPTDGLLKFDAVMSPDYSTYTDMPMILQIYNHYRKNWLAQYWQSRGVRVIPTISWSDHRSFEWCFDGEPRGAVVVISTVGWVKGNDEASRKISTTARTSALSNNILSMFKCPDIYSGGTLTDIYWIFNVPNDDTNIVPGQQFTIGGRKFVIVYNERYTHSAQPWLAIPLN